MQSTHKREYHFEGEVSAPMCPLNNEMCPVAILRKENADLRAQLQQNAAKIADLTKRLEEKQTNCVSNAEGNTGSNAEGSIEKTPDEKDQIIAALEDKVASLEARANLDSSTSGFPTSQTSISKKKYIPRIRPKTDLSVGGQIGHAGAHMEVPPDEEVTDVVDHTMSPEDGDTCPRCGSSNFEPTGEVKEKTEVTVKISTEVIRHKFYGYKCNDCGKTFTSPIPPDLKDPAQYGNEVKALSLSLGNTHNCPYNKIRTFFQGVTNEKVGPSEAYLCKVQKRAAEALEPFIEELRSKLATETDLFVWDDTVVDVNGERCCMRVYTTNDMALYTAHEEKGLKGLDEDNILQNLSSDVTVVHDHNKVNYNDKYKFKNAECNQHLLRAILRASKETKHAEWDAIHELIQTALHDRTLLVGKGIDSFDGGYNLNFELRIYGYLGILDKKNADVKSSESRKFEANLIRRMREYFPNDFAWMLDFSIPTTSNLAERSLRPVKTKMKVSGQFKKNDTSGYYANVKSYIETARRNGINEYTALMRLVEGNPFTLAEMLSYPGKP